MRILIIRHGDPYYPTDSLTEKGQREAELLSQKLINEGITNIYVSPHGRAKLTAKPTADKLDIEPIELDWLREFPNLLEWEYNTDYFKNKKIFEQVLITQSAEEFILCRSTYDMLNSDSWKITRPLRKAKDVAKKAYHKIV